MSNRLLRLHDGFDHASPELREEVKELQTKLNRQGFSLDVDGLFGYDLEDAVKQFQAQHGLDDDGIVGPCTWAALFGTEPPNPDLVFPTTFQSNSTSLLQDFSEAAKFKAFIDEGARKFGFLAPVIGGVGSPIARLPSGQPQPSVHPRRPSAPRTYSQAVSPGPRHDGRFTA